MTGRRSDLEDKARSMVPMLFARVKDDRPTLFMVCIEPGCFDTIRYVGDGRWIYCYSIADKGKIIAPWLHGPVLCDSIIPVEADISPIVEVAR